MSLFEEFDFLFSTPSIKERRVNLTQIDGFTISTVRCYDVEGFEYETAVLHENYNSNDWMIVEHYTSLEDAESGHHEWVGKCLNKPTVFVDRTQFCRLGVMLGKEEEIFERDCSQKDEE